MVGLLRFVDNRSILFQQVDNFFGFQIDVGRQILVSDVYKLTSDLIQKGFVVVRINRFFKDVMKRFDYISWRAFRCDDDVGMVAAL